MASKGMGPLPRRRGSALAHGCGTSGRGALPLPRAAAVSTRLSVREDRDAQRVGPDVIDKARVAAGRVPRVPLAHLHVRVG